MKLSDYRRVLRRHWLLILSCAVLGVIAAGALSFLRTPTYESTTTLFAATQNTGSAAELQLGNSFTQARIQSYAETAATPVVLQPVIDALALDITPFQLATRIRASADLDTVLLSITAEDASPVQAAAIAQSIAESLIEAINDLESTSDGQGSPVKLTVVAPAVAASEPSSPNTKTNLALGLFAGLAIGAGLAVLKTTLDVLVRVEADLRKVSDAPVLGTILFSEDAAKKPLVTQTTTQSQRAESFRQLRTNLQFAHVSYKSKAVLVTSSIPGEGKSTTATNLAIAMAQSGQSVVLVDADLRRPRVDEYLGLERNAGLTTALIGRADLEDLLQPWGSDELYVLTAGQIPPNPSELLGSQAMKELIERLERKFDAVIIDAPPLLPVTDGAVLAQQVGGVVLVIGSSKVKLPDLQKSLGNLDMVGADLLGVVINLLPSKGPDAYAYSYYSYASATESETRKVPAAVRRVAPDNSSDFDERVLGLQSQDK